MHLILKLPCVPVAQWSTTTAAGRALVSRAGRSVGLGQARVEVTQVGNAWYGMLTIMDITITIELKNCALGRSLHVHDYH